MGLITVPLLLAGSLLLAFAALHDIGFRTVPNRVPALILVFGLLLRAEHGELPAGLACGAIMFAVTYAFWRFGWIGGADAKLLSACAVFVPPAIVPTMVASTASAGGGVAGIYLVAGSLAPRGIIRAAPRANILVRIRQCELRRLRRRGPLPYAAAIATGSWLAIAGS